VFNLMALLLIPNNADDILLVMSKFDMYTLPHSSTFKVLV